MTIAKYVSSFVFLTVLCQKNCIKYKFYLSQIKFWRKITTSLIQWFSENLTSLPSHLLSHNWDVFHVDEWNTHLRNLVRLHRFPPAGCHICSYSVPSNDAYITLMYWWEAHITLLTSLSAKKKIIQMWRTANLVARHKIRIWQLCYCKHPSSCSRHWDQMQTLNEK